MIGGEELHNNHHAFASSARFSSKWWEFDLGWSYIRFLETFNLARVRKIAPQLLVDAQKNDIDLDTVKAIISNRLHVMSRYTRQVVSRVYREERLKSSEAGKRILRNGKRLITRSEAIMDEVSQQKLETLLQHNASMQVIYEFSQRLQALWNEKTASHEKILQSLRQWCEDAEATGIEALEDFAQTLSSYSLQAA